MTSRTHQLAIGVIFGVFALSLQEAAIAGTPGAAGAPGDAGGDRVRLLDLTARVPPNWTLQSPTSSMRLAQFRVPGTPGSDEAEAVVFYFGQGQGGSVDANIARWQSQFSSPDGKPVTPSIQRFKVRAMPVTVAEFTGSYARSVGMGGAGPAKSDQTLLSAIVERPKGNLWFQIHGPRATVRANREAFLAMVRGIK